MFSLQTIFGSGKQFYWLLNEAAQAAYDSTNALHAMMRESDRQPALDAFKLARLRERAASDKIGQALVDSFMTPIEREDIEALGSALYKIPKQVEKFADRYSLATKHLEHIDFAPRAAMLEQAASVVVEMVTYLPQMNIDRVSALNDKLRMLEKRSRPADAGAVPRHLFRPPGHVADVPAQGVLRDSGKRPSTVAARPVWWSTRSC